MSTEEIQREFATYWRVCEFLAKESHLIDERRFDEWLEMMTDDIEYKVPIREIRERTQDEFGDAYYVYDNRHRLEKRVERLDTQHAWAEDPPTRTRHFVSNVWIESESDEGLRVKSNLVLSVNYAWIRDDDPEPKIMTAQRDDRLVREDDGLKLDDRTVYMDQSVSPLPNISVFV